MQSTIKSKKKTELTDMEQYFVELQNHCALCNTELEIKIQNDFQEYSIREQAECPKCRIKTREKSHPVH